jgi:hypothetical protein
MGEGDAGPAVPAMFMLSSHGNEPGSKSELASAKFSAMLDSQPTQDIRTMGGAPPPRSQLRMVSLLLPAGAVDASDAGQQPERFIASIRQTAAYRIAWEGPAHSS